MNDRSDERTETDERVAENQGGPAPIAPATRDPHQQGEGGRPPGIDDDHRTPISPK